MPPAMDSMRYNPWVSHVRGHRRFDEYTDTRSVHVRSLWTVFCDYNARDDDELTLKQGETVEVLSTNERISGVEGWWTGKIGDKVGIFPSQLVSKPIPAINYSDIEFNRVVGAGTFGKVHCGFWNGFCVAVKSPFVDLNNDINVAVKEVRHEANLLWLLKHENIVQLMGVCLQPPNLCLVMEYCEGGSLYRILANYKIGPGILLDWATQIAKGMSYLHNYAPIRNIIHRDLKSMNVLVAEAIENDDLRFKTIKITDFGLARVMCKTAKMSADAGTVQWMAPEVIKTSTYSRSGDVWSYGVLLWELLAGEIPYKEFDKFAVVYGVATNTLSLPIPSSCPQQLRELIEACQEYDPRKRPTFKQILKDLEVISRSTFSQTPDELFHSTQIDWRIEIARELEKKKKELNEREDGIIHAEMQQRLQEQDIEKKKMELDQRETNVVVREQLMVAIFHRIRRFVSRRKFA